MAQPVQHFVVFHKPGPNWPACGLSFDDPMAQKHGEYFGKLHANGSVIYGGPFPGGSGGMMVFESNLSKEEVERIVQEDPAYKSGVIDFEIKLWLKVFGK